MPVAVRNAILLGVSVGLLVLAVSLPRRLFDEGPPSFEVVDCVALALALAACLPIGWIAWREDGGAGSSMPPRDIAVIGVALGRAIFLAGTMAVSPSTFNTLVVEDGPVEWISALALFAGGALAAIALLRGRAQHWIERLFVGGIGLALVVIGLEEVSWFQRVLAVPTPEWLDRINGQREINFHNVSTGLFENLYYVGSTLALAGGRVLLALPGHTALAARIRSYAPGIPALSVIALSCAFTWDMWRIVFIEAALGLALVMLVVELALAMRNRQPVASSLLVATIAATVGIQLLFLYQGHAMVRMWDATEAREGFIALALALYAAQLAFPRPPATQGDSP